MNIKKIAQYIDQEKLFTREDKILVTLSGGADSVALLRLLLDMGYTCETAHCNFHLRGDESVRDEMFVRELCLQLEVPLHVQHFQTTEEAAKRHISIEMAARTTPRMAAFIPGASPPLVKTPIFFIQDHPFI